MPRRGELPGHIHRRDLQTGRKEVWAELMPTDAAGAIRLDTVLVSRDGRVYAYTVAHVVSSDLYILDGLL